MRGIHTYIQIAYIHDTITLMHTYIQAGIHTGIHTYIQAYRHTHRQGYIYIHTYIQAIAIPCHTIPGIPTH